MTRKRTKTITQFILILASAVIFTGCNSFLVGSWKADPVPTDTDFFINTAKFKNDDTFTAVAKSGEEDVLLAGIYQYNGWTLTFKRPGKKDRVYKPAVYYLTGMLKITVGDKKYTLKKQ